MVKSMLVVTFSGDMARRERPNRILPKGGECGKHKKFCEVLLFSLRRAE